MLEVEDLRVAYGSAEALRGIELSIKAGETFGVVGPNGAGKSTLLKAICGLVPVKAGEITLGDRSLRGLTPEQIARLGVGLVPEGRQIFGRLTVAENLALGARGDWNSVAELLRRFPILAQRAEQRASLLSGGEQQQLALARTLAGKPRLLMLDEPSLGLAPEMIDLIYSLLSQLREGGMTMLLVEQSVALTIDFCDRSIVLSGGQTRAAGTREQLKRNPAVFNAYLGRQA